MKFQVFLFTFFTIAIVLSGIVAIWGFQWATSPFRGALEARETILSGQSRINAYNHFFDLCSSIQAQEDRIKIFQEQIETADEDDKSRIQTNLVGAQSARAEAIRKYNTDSQKDYTIAQFKDLSLPFVIEIGEENTKCGIS